jgi:beta propeller repeat protein
MDIWMYDINSGITTALTSNSGDFNGAIENIDPVISGDVVVWRQRNITVQNNQNTDIVAYNIPSGKKTVVSEGNWEKTNARIEGDRVVWEDSRKDTRDRDIYLYNLTTGQELVVCNAPDTQREPKISGNRIVWDDHRSGDWDIYTYDIPTGSETLVATGPTEQENSDISGDCIVWIELPSMLFYNPNDESNRLMMYDLSTGDEYQVLENIPNMFAPVISENRIIYLDLAQIPAGQRDIQREDPAQEISLFTLDPVAFPPAIPENRSEALIQVASRYHDLFAGSRDGITKRNL